MSCSHKATSPVGHLPTCRPRNFGYQERMRFCRCACSSVFGQQGARTTRYSLNWWWRSECRDTSRAQKTCCDRIRAHRHASSAWISAGSRFQRWFFKHKQPLAQTDGEILTLSMRAARSSLLGHGETLRGWLQLCTSGEWTVSHCLCVCFYSSVRVCFCTIDCDICCRTFLQRLGLTLG